MLLYEFRSFFKFFFFLFYFLFGKPVPRFAGSCLINLRAFLLFNLLYFFFLGQIHNYIQHVYPLRIAENPSAVYSMVLFITPCLPKKLVYVFHSRFPVGTKKMTHLIKVDLGSVLAQYLALEAADAAEEKTGALQHADAFNLLLP